MNRDQFAALAESARAAREAFYCDEFATDDMSDYVQAAVACTVAKDAFAMAALAVLPVLLRRLDLAEQALAAITGYDQPDADNLTQAVDQLHERTDAYEKARAALAEIRRPFDTEDTP